MSPPDTEKQNGPGGVAAPTRAENDQQMAAEDKATVAQPADKVNTIFPAAIARAHPPSGRRRLWVSVVERCPYCGGDHVHRGTDAGPVKGMRAAGCTRRVYYVVPLIKKAVTR
jgi:hypothetical protein